MRTLTVEEALEDTFWWRTMWPTVDKHLWLQGGTGSVSVAFLVPWSNTGTPPSCLLASFPSPASWHDNKRCPKDTYILSQNLQCLVLGWTNNFWGYAAREKSVQMYDASWARRWKKTKLWASHSLSSCDCHNVSTCVLGTENNSSALNFPLADSRVVSADKSGKPMGPKSGIHDSLRSLHHVLLSDMSNHCQWSQSVIYFHPNKAQWVHVLCVLFFCFVFLIVTCCAHFIRLAPASIF